MLLTLAVSRAVTVRLAGSGEIGGEYGYAEVTIFGSRLGGVGGIVGGRERPDRLIPTTAGHAYATSIGAGDTVATPQRADR